MKAEYTYKDEFKNPFLATPGMEYSFIYPNSGFGIGVGKKWYSSEKITLYDDNGDPFIDYEQDPKLTIWQANEHAYPINVDYVDKLGKGHISNTFEYENCEPGLACKAAGLKQNSFNKNDGHSKSIRALLHGPSNNTIEKLKAENLSKQNN